MFSLGNQVNINFPVAVKIEQSDIGRVPSIVLETQSVVDAC